MNLRLPAVLSVVAVAAGCAVVRGLHAAPSAVAPVFASSLEGAAPQPSSSARRQSAPRPARIVVYVAGAVVHGGVYRLAPASRAIDALHAAGGATAGADLVAVNLAAPLTDGDEVVVPAIGTVDDTTAGSTSVTGTHRKRKRHRAKHHKRHKRVTESVASVDDSSSASASESGDAATGTADASTATPIDINSADANALETLPGIGSKLAERIVTFRELNGPFVAHDDLLDVGGMTQKRLDAIEPFLLPS